MENTKIKKKRMPVIDPEVAAGREREAGKIAERDRGRDEMQEQRDRHNEYLAGGAPMPKPEGK